MQDYVVPVSQPLMKGIYHSSVANDVFKRPWSVLVYPQLRVFLWGKTFSAFISLTLSFTGHGRYSFNTCLHIVLVLVKYVCRLFLRTLHIHCLWLNWKCFLHYLRDVTYLSKSIVLLLLSYKAVLTHKSGVFLPLPPQ